VPASQVYKTVLMRRLLAYPQYDKDVEPPVTEGNGNTTVRFGLNLLCATPADDFVIVESWVLMVSIYCFNAVSVFALNPYQHTLNNH